MKKNSTVAMGRKQNFKPATLTIGLDLGDRTSHSCMLDETGNVILERRLPTTANGMRQTFSKIPRRRMALETGTHSPWVSRQLSQMGHEVIVAHARNVRLIGESSGKDDRLDVRTLARLARIDPGLLGPVRHRSVQAQIQLTVIRARAALVSTRMALVNATRGLTKSYGERLAPCGTEQINRDSAQRVAVVSFH
jgi:transposase